MAEKNMNAKISVEFEETANRQQLSSGDNLPTLFGKTKKFLSDLKPVALTGSYNDLTDTPESSTPVLNTANGNPITITDGADAPLIEYRLFGKTVNGINIGNDGIDVISYNDNNISVMSYRTMGSIITSQPASAIVKTDETAIFSVDGGTSYQWQQNTGAGWSDIATSAGRNKSFNIAGATFRNGYQYRCVVTDTDGNSETSNIATLYTVSDNFTGVTGSVSFTTLPITLASVDNVVDELICNENSCKIIQRISDGVVLTSPIEHILTVESCLRTYSGTFTINNNNEAEMYVKYWCDDSISNIMTQHTSNQSNPHNVTKTQIGLGNVENKSSATIRGEITKANVTDALGYTPPESDTVYTHPTSGITAGSYRNVTVDAQGHVTAGNNATITISQGGTNATTAKGAEYNIIGGITEAEGAISDNTPIVGKYSTPSATTGVLHWRKASAIWDYVKGKISSVLGLTATEYSGNAATATKAEALSNTSAIGSATNPVYINASGQPVKTTYTLGKSVPSNAVFTDTTYEEATETASGLLSAADKQKLNSLDNSATALTATASGSGSISITDASTAPVIAFSIQGNSTSATDGFDIVSKNDTEISLVSYRTTDDIITKQPCSVILKNSQTAVISVAGGATYQWQQNTTGTWSDIATTAGRSANFTLTGASFRDGYKYRCVVTDADGNSSTSNVATLYFAPDSYTGQTGAITATTIAPLTSVGSVYDELIYNNGGECKIIRRVENGSALSTPTETAMSESEKIAFGKLVIYSGNTTISNNINGQMSVTYWCDDSIASVLNTKANVSDVLPLSGGMMSGALIAQANTNYTTAQVRNVTMSTEAASGGSNGQIHYQYE